MITLSVRPYTFQFNFNAITSRGALQTKPVYIITLCNEHNVKGIGEVSLLPGLSADDGPELEQTLMQMPRIFQSDCDIEETIAGLQTFPSIKFGLETALIHLKNNGQCYFGNAFTQGAEPVAINGLVWMGTPDEMWHRMEEKVSEKYRCIKMKIGTYHFDDELVVLNRFRQKYGYEIELRADANGAYNAANVNQHLDRLAKLKLHSIEQPVKANNHALMAQVCNNSPIPVALDEELIGISGSDQKEQLLEEIKPAHLVLKPGLLGGFSACEEWIALANKLNIGYWITSSLESNIALTAIAQWSYNFAMPDMFQGLGTGKLYKENFDSQLEICEGNLWFRP